MLNPITMAVRKYHPVSNKENLDRFIPNRSATKFDFALAKGWKEKIDPDSCSPTKAAYQRRLRQVFNLEDSRILAYKNKPPLPAGLWLKDDDVDAVVRPSRPAKSQRHMPQAAERTLDAPGLSDDYYVNLLDWGSNNVLAVALENSVHLWNVSTDSISELVTVSDDIGPVTSVSWAPDGNHIALGFENSHVQLWDSTANIMLRTLKGHRGRVGSLAWNSHILTTGSADSNVINNDVRVRDHVVETYEGHRGEVCGLKWSGSGQQLASGGNDNTVLIWDRAISSSRTTESRWLHSFEDHKAAVRALAWCPFQSNLLATGGGGADGCIKFWNTHTGACLNSVDTGSAVCSLLWSKNDRELLSSHWSDQNQLTLWKYPSMAKIAERTGHQSRVLYTAQSPDGSTVASAAGALDETLQLWKLFGDTPPKPVEPERDAPGTFAHYSRIR